MTTRHTDLDTVLGPVTIVADGDAITGLYFDRAVWEIIGGIPFGQTTTYGAIAERLGGKTLAQRVGRAAGANPLSIFVPYHRVVGADGSLTGYAGGLERKRALLELEQQDRETSAKTRA